MSKPKAPAVPTVLRQCKVGDRVRVRFADGEREVRVTGDATAHDWRLVRDVLPTAPLLAEPPAALIGPPYAASCALSVLELLERNG